jgi:hypothetical protein
MKIRRYCHGRFSNRCTNLKRLAWSFIIICLVLILCRASIKPILGSLDYNDSKSWNIKLSQIVFALHTAPNESTGN